MAHDAVHRAVADALGSDAQHPEVASVARVFVQVIQPLRADSLARRSQDLRDRTRAFVDNRNLSDAEVEAATRAGVAAVPDLDIEAFIRTLGTARLRTYSATQLRVVAQHFSRWHPLVASLLNSGPPLSGEIESALAALCRRTARVVSEDASQAAIETALRSAAARYSYDYDLFSWFCRIARSHRRSSREPAVADLDSAIPPSQMEELAHRERFREEHDRALLVLHTFSPGLRTRVRAILLEPLVLPTRSNREVIDVLSAEAGTEITPGAYRLTQLRVRRRLAALQFVRDRVPDGAPDDPGDASMLAWVASVHGGLDEDEDRSVLREVAGSARACGRERVVWALFSRLLVTPGVPVPEARQVVEPHLQQGDGQLHNLSHEWLATASELAARHQTELHELRRTALSRAVEFLFAPCWHLRSVRASSESDVSLILHPALHEESDVKWLASSLWLLQ